jgi:PAS domain S-box-containing protein
MAEPRMRVMIVDDDRTFREALADTISGEPGFELIGQGVDHPEAIRLASEIRPQVVVLDARMPGGDAPSTVRAIRDRDPHAEIIILSAYEDAASAVELLSAGASGYLVKGAAYGEILEAVARAARGQLSLSTALAQECVKLLRRDVESGRRAQAGTIRNLIIMRQLLARVSDAAMVVGGEGRIEMANARVEQVFGYQRNSLVGEQITRLVPAFRPGEPAHELFARLVTAEPHREESPGAHFTTVARRKDGDELPVELSMTRLLGAPSAVAVFARELRDGPDEDARHREMFESYPDATAVVDANGVIRQVNRATEDLFGYSRAELEGQSVDILLPEHPIMYRRESDEPTGSGAAAITVGLELLGRRRDGVNFPVDMSISRVRTREGMQILLSMRDMTEAVGSRAVLEHSVEVLRAAGQEHRRLLVNLVRAQERERTRVAAGIHDDSIQVITAAALRLQQLRRRLSDPEDLKILSKLEENVRLAADRLRRMIFDFQPPALGQEGLVAALLTYLDQMQIDTGLTYDVDSELTEEPPEGTRVVIYRIAQEALMNVLKHARAGRVRARLTEVNDGFLMQIVDDGVGYDPLEAEARSGHLGLTLMRDRAELVGGWCRAESTPGAGTTVEFWVPRDAGTADTSE